VGFGEALVPGLFAILNEEAAKLLDDFEEAIPFLFD